MEKRLAFLGTLGSNAPFIGLLGTVIGIIRAFHELNSAGGKVTSGLMAEVGEALVATAIGILVALPAIASSTHSNGSSKRGWRGHRRSGTRSWRCSRPSACRLICASTLSADAARTTAIAGTLQPGGGIAMAAQAANDDDIITGINVTPLVDITLVLLVILMVTASYVTSRAIPVELPKGATGEGTPTTLTISIDKDGKTFLDAETIADAALQPSQGGARRRSRHACRHRGGRANQPRERHPRHRPA